MVYVIDIEPGEDIVNTTLDKHDTQIFGSTLYKVSFGHFQIIISILFVL